MTNWKKATLVNQIYRVVLLVITACVPEENGDIPDYQSRQSISKVESLEAVLDLGKSESKPSTFLYFTLKSVDPGGQEITLFPFNSTLVEEFILENSRANDGKIHGDSALKILSLYSSNQKEWKVKISGQLKKNYPNDTISEIPFLLEKIEPLESCSLVNQVKDEKIPFQETLWKWKGFLNEKGQIYSLPSCENPEATLKLSTKRMPEGGPGYYNPQYPEAFYLELFPGYFFKSTPFLLYELGTSSLNIYSSVWIGPNPQDVVPKMYTSRQTAEKADSLFSLFSPNSKINLGLTGNQLIFENKEKKIKALFSHD